VADVNGDGRDECLFSMGKTIYAVGAAKAGADAGLTGEASCAEGAILWTLDLPDRLGPLTIADVEGNGVARIVVGCADGHVYGIGPGTEDIAEAR
jgi:hypothetical protein